ncbi:GDSL-type esterase/lipase family protein [Propionispora hippei]|uniref:Lysophospholipase L1 n=1 Tax=Propionispora hippei DSM 15287 TaxID=1123003 RepID=A0A1M6DWZ3_9FIRM|nr:GDSL-type esterase/lipase family protein [Propionispora hippei]SHI77797.1 Lysophospholipase L1 [Propionispora hippei DSM 15287]
MKIRCITIALLALFIGLTHFYSPLAAIAQEDEARFWDWSNQLGRTPQDPPYLTLHYRVRSLYFSLEPHSVHPIVFLGDSMTDEGNWSRLFPQYPVLNRGIGGDSTLGVLHRLQQVTDLKPAKVFLMIGTNDLCYNRSIPDIMENYQRIIDQVKQKSPETKIYVESVLPFNDELFPARNKRTNSNIKQLNRQIEQLAKNTGCRYLNLVPAFSDSNGRLPAVYTTDGLHLNELGYQVWRDQISGQVNLF